MKCYSQDLKVAGWRARALRKYRIYYSCLINLNIYNNMADGSYWAKAYASNSSFTEIAISDTSPIRHIMLPVSGREMLGVFVSQILVT